MIKVLKARTKNGIEKYLTDVKNELVQVLSIRDDGKHWTAVVVLK